METRRKDAQSNRRDILNAADEVFSVHGVTAPLDLVCKVAGVGRATLYRHFPEREQLLLALLERALEETAQHAATLGERDDAFFEMLRFQAGTLSIRSALLDYWRVLDRNSNEVRRIRERFHGIYLPLILRAVEAGLCRADFRIEDVGLVIGMLGSSLRVAVPSERARFGLRAFDLIVGGLGPVSAAADDTEGA